MRMCDRVGFVRTGSHVVSARAYIGTRPHGFLVGSAQQTEKSERCSSSRGANQSLGIDNSENSIYFLCLYILTRSHVFFCWLDRPAADEVVE